MFIVGQGIVCRVDLLLLVNVSYFWEYERNRMFEKASLETWKNII